MQLPMSQLCKLEKCRFRPGVTESDFGDAQSWYSEPNKLKVARHYDQKLEPRYADVCATIIADVMPESAVDCVWDVGCGEGLLADRLFSHYPRTRYMGFDPNPGEGPQWASRAQGKSKRFVCARMADVVRLLAKGAPPPALVVSSLNFALWDDPEGELMELAELTHGRSTIFLVDLLRTGSLKPVSPDKVDLRSFLITQYNVSLTPTVIVECAVATGRDYRLNFFKDDGRNLVETSEPSAGYGSVFSLLLKPE